MKKIISYLKQDYEIDCWSERKIPTKIGFALNVISYFYDILLCDIFGHDVEMFDDGDIENGPKCYGECKRCGKPF